jgi:hypothetical protein
VRVRRADVRDHPVGAGHLEADLHEREPFVVVERGELTGGAGHEQAVCDPSDEAEQPSRGGRVQRAVRGEGGGNSGKDDVCHRRGPDQRFRPVTGLLPEDSEEDSALNHADESERQRKKSEHRPITQMARTMPVAAMNVAEPRVVPMFSYV